MFAGWPLHLWATAWRRRAGRDAALEQLRAENRQLRHSLLAAREQERTRLGQALHDDLGQYLAGIRAQVCLLRVVAGQPETVTQTALALEHNCQQLQQGFRALVRDLYPEVPQPLPQALASLVGQWQGTHGIDCRLQVSPRLPVLPVASQTHLYRFIQEALTNVARHACATGVRVRLQTRGTGLRLLIRDNGRGAARPQSPGIGLRSLAQRAHSLGGGLRIVSPAGGGWALILSIVGEGR